MRPNLPARRVRGRRIPGHLNFLTAPPSRRFGARRNLRPREAGDRAAVRRAADALANSVPFIASTTSSHLRKTAMTSPLRAMLGITVTATTALALLATPAGATAVPHFKLPKVYGTTYQTDAKHDFTKVISPRHDGILRGW